MQTAINTLKAMEFDTTSSTRAVQEVRARIMESSDPLGEAVFIVNDITGINVEFADVPTALHVAQYVVYDAITVEKYEYQDSIDSAFKRTAKLFESQPWAKAKTESEFTTTTNNEVQVAVAKGVELKVAVKADGSIKKGGKQVLAVELYKVHVVNAKEPLNNQSFIAILMKELGMTKAGATTYAYNCRKQFAA